MTRPFPPGSLSGSQSWASQAKSDTTADYVEDSEPEREERRLQAAKTRPVKRKKTPVVLVPQPAQDVIELTDTSPSRPSTPDRRPANIQLAPLVIIDVSDSEESSTDRLRGTSREGGSDHVVINGLGIEISGDHTLEDSLPSIRRVLGLPKASNQKPPDSPPRPMSTRTSPDLSEHESDAGSEPGKLKLGHFAYAAPNPLRRTASKTPSPLERDSQTPEVTSGVKRTVTPTHRFTEDFTDAQLSRLFKCVSCELTWTARKTVKEKMKHIQSCAKKNRLTDETVRVLLRTELAKLPPVASSSKSKASPGPPAPSAPETLLEETLKDKRSKRSGPRKQVERTVKNVSETRGSILDKARLLLQNVHDGTPGRSVSHQLGESCISSTGAGSAMPPATQAFTRSNVAVINGLPGIHPADTTQVFGSSRLGVARIQGGIVDAGAAIAGESDISPLTQVFTRSALASAMVKVGFANGMPPAAQVFSPSKLTNSAGISRTVVPANEDAMDEPVSLHDTSEDELDLSKSSPARPSVIEISSSPSSNTSFLPPLATLMNPRVATVAPAALDLRSRSPLARGSPSPAGDDGSPAHYGNDCDVDFGVQDGYKYQWNDWADEHDLWDEYGGGGDAFLHYHPEADSEPLTRSGKGSGSKPSPPGSSQRTPRRLLAAIPEGEVPVAGPSKIREQPVPVPPLVEPVVKKKQGRLKKVTTDESDAEPGAAAGKDISQEDLNAKLKEAILKDEVLHLRILRYEPIHFDVFMQLAADNGVTEKKTRLKGKVRSFLDQKAIHFYGAEPTKSRTKRTRNP